MAKAKKPAVYQAHDKFFKLTFADKGVKESFIQTYLPKELVREIDLSTVEEVSPSFISENFQLTESDLLVKARAMENTIYILFLMEHKSYKNRKTPFQILRYFVDIWESQLAKKEKLTPILPVVIYEGENKWDYPQIGEYFKDLPDKWKVYLPLYETLFLDFSLEKNKDLFDLLKGADPMRKTSIERWEERIRKEVVNTARNDILAEGREQGREEGRNVEKQNIAQKMKSMGFSLDDIQKVTGQML